MASIITNANDDEDESSSWSDVEEKNEGTVTNKPVTENDFFEMQQKAMNSEWMLNTPMVKWTDKQLQMWITTLSATELEKQAMSKEFNGNKLLQCNNYKGLMKQLNIEENEAKELFEEIEFQKKIEKEKQYSSKFSNTLGPKNKTILKDALRYKTKVITKWTVEQTAEWIKSLKLKKQNEREVIFKLTECSFDGEIITNYLGDNGFIELSKILDIKPSIATIIYMAAKERLKKDMIKINDDDDEKFNVKKEKKKLTPLQTQYRNRNINTKKYAHIVLSNDEDIIMKYNNDDCILRAKMPGCGHAIAAETMYFYIKSVFEKHSNATDILCPHPKCRKPWDWSYCVMVADMNDEEMAYWNKERQERMAFINFRKCPFCGIMCDKPDNLGTLRVRCNCGKPDWCWICSKKWTSSSRRACGNKDCTLVKEVNNALANAELFEPMGLKGKQIKIPELRACPICMTIIHHIKEDDKYGHHCKHVTCPVCKPPVQFCFVCLGIRDTKKGWPCGSYATACTPEAVQKFE